MARHPWRPVWWSGSRGRFASPVPPVLEPERVAASLRELEGGGRRDRRPRPARGDRGAPPASRALEPAIPQPPAALTALWVDEPGRPAQPLQVVQAVRVGGEPGQELPGRRRVVQAGHRASDHGRDPTALLRLDGYPRRPVVVAMWSRTAR